MLVDSDRVDTREPRSIPHHSAFFFYVLALHKKSNMIVTFLHQIFLLLQNEKNQVIVRMYVWTLKCG